MTRVRTDAPIAAETSRAAPGRAAGGAPAGDVFAGSSEMASLMRAHDWRSTPLGPLEQWPQSLRTAVSICLQSRFPILLWWGTELVMLYNDAYRPMLGAVKHPSALGSPGAACWPEIWDIIGPMLQGVLDRGEATWSDDQLLVLERNGYAEECYFTFSYSPIRDESGGVGGVFTAVTETTQHVVGERRLRTLRELAARTADAETAEEACSRAATVLAENPEDIPFALVYLVGADGKCATLAGNVGVATETPASPAAVDLTIARTDGASWPLERVARTAAAETIDDPVGRCGLPRVGPWPEAPRSALVLPISTAGQEGVAALLVAGVSARRALDDDYRGFYDLIAGQIGSAIANARGREAERRRAEALAELDRAKTVFFSNVSHELRTPLTLLLGPLEEARETASPRARASLELAHRNAARLLKLVNVLLDFSSIEAGRVQATYEPTDLAALTADLASVFRSAVERAGLRLSVDCPPLPRRVYVDREMWEKIVLNLLSNALKFTTVGEIAVTLRASGAQVALEVRDTGVGIPPAELPHIFERFRRADNSRGRTFEGTGIGLALVEELVRLHGGDIEVESQEDVGTTFTVRLPLGSAHLPAEQVRDEPGHAAASPATQPYVEEALRWLPGSGPGEARGVDEGLGIGLALGGTLAMDRPRVLVADDNADMRDYLRRIFEPRYVVETVPDGEAALAAVEAHVPDLVVADVMMPRLDGFGLLRAVRASPRMNRIPVVLLSARAGEEAKVEGLAAGADDYLVKPFSARELVARVEAHVALARTRAEATRREHELREDVERERRRLFELLMQAPAAICVLRGPGLVFEFANPWYAEVVGRSDLVGKPVRAALPELEGQGFFELLESVYASGERHVGREALVRLDRRHDGRLEDVYFTFVYEPLRDGSGQVDGVFVHAVEVTDLVQARRDIAAEHGRLRQVIDVMPEAVVIADATTGAFILANRASAEILGTSVTGERVLRGPAPAFGSRRFDGTPIAADDLPLQRALGGEIVNGAQYVIRNQRTGRDTPVLVNSVPLKAESGETVGAVAVFQDISAIKDLEREKDEFLATVSHDLQQPLSAIKGRVYLLKRALARGDAEAEKMDRGLTSIDVSAGRMRDQIVGLLDGLRLEMGRPLDLHREPVDLVPLVKSAVDEVGETIDTHALVMDTDLAGLVATVDAGRLRRVLGNLLSNAVKFSPAGTEVRVRLRREATPAGPVAVLAVEDRGVGIPAAELPHVFERFRRGSNVAGRTEGTGVGLASVRQIVEQHGGAVRVESAEGLGSTFVVQLPL